MYHNKRLNKIKCQFISLWNESVLWIFLSNCFIDWRISELDQNDKILTKNNCCGAFYIVVMSNNNIISFKMIKNDIFFNTFKINWNKCVWWMCNDATYILIVTDKFFFFFFVLCCYLTTTIIILIFWIIFEIFF